MLVSKIMPCMSKYSNIQ